MHFLGGPSLFELGGAAIKIATLHTFWMVCPTSYLLRNRREICTRKTCIPCTVLYHRNPPQLWRYTSLMRRSLKHLDLLISPSEFVRERHVEELGETPIQCIPSWAPQVLKDDGAAPPSYLQNYLEGGRKYFLYVGRLAHVKGVHVLIRAFQASCNRHLVIVGDGPDKEKLRALARGERRIHFLGHQPWQKLGEIYKHAAALVVPSIWHEVFGLVVVEAMSWGVPLIANDVGALTELVTSNEAGIVYQDEQGLRRALSEFDESSETARRFAANARRAAQDRYTRKRHMDRYFKLVEDLARQA